MSLKTLLATMKSGKILLPILNDFLAKSERQVAAKTKRKKAGVVKDSKLTIKAMQERIAEFNHGEEIEGEYFHPSALGGCLRRTWFAVKKAPPEPEAKADLLRTYLTFEIGTYCHIILQNLMERAGILEVREAAIKDSVRRILGHGDAIVRIAGIRYLVEIKTINLRGFTTVAQQPLHEHKIQVHAYMKSLGIQWVIFLYISKDTGEVREHVLQFDQAFYEKYVTSRIESFFNDVRANKLPQREEGKNCTYCQFQHLCFNDKELKTFVKSL
jgi:CRISPR/Cas system-associated exonuclease Cas4 (RecB family)